jgi:hypothetical protein
MFPGGTRLFSPLPLELEAEMKNRRKKSGWPIVHDRGAEHAEKMFNHGKQIVSEMFIKCPLEHDKAGILE